MKQGIKIIIYVVLLIRNNYPLEEPGHMVKLKEQRKDFLYITIITIYKKAEM
jgi:hypothetical protein